MASGIQTIPYNEDYSLMIYQSDTLTNDTYITTDMRYSLNGTIGATDTYTGEFNTDLIIEFNGATNTVAKICKDLVLGGYDDWYLPSTEEMTAIYNAGYVNFTGEYLWTSTEYSFNSGYAINTDTGELIGLNRNSYRSSIPVRKVYLNDYVIIERMNVQSRQADILRGGENNADEDVYKMLGGVNGISKNSNILSNE